MKSKHTLFNVSLAITPSALNYNCFGFFWIHNFDMHLDISKNYVYLEISK
jgi:hypothetical protein